MFKSLKSIAVSLPCKLSKTFIPIATPKNIYEARPFVLTIKICGNTKPMSKPIALKHSKADVRAPA